MKRPILRGRDLRLPAAIVVAVLAGELAVWLLRPAVDLEPEVVSQYDYFSRAELERAGDFVSVQRALGIGGLIAEGALLVLLVVRPPRAALGRVRQLARGRPLVAGAIVGAGLISALTLAGLPFAVAAHQRSVDFDLSTQDWAGFLSDLGKSAAIGAALAGAGAALALALMRRFRGRWWIAAAATVVVLEVVFVWLAPVVLAPLFNTYTQLPEGRTRSDLIELARDNGVEVDDVLEVDASRRTNAVNAYVTGIGTTKRIVIYDTLLEDYSPGQVRLVVAHELAHVKQRDVPRGLLWTALFAPGAMFVVMLLTERWSRRAGSRPGEPGSLFALALALAIVSAGGVISSNQLSRQVERRADQFALEATGEPQRFIDLERRLAISNVSEPDPPPLLHDLLGTHPTTIERIGAALRYEASRRDPSTPIRKH